MSNGQDHDYDFGNKRHYRRTILGTFATHAGPRRKESMLLLMPGLNGKEVDLAVSIGFHQANICAVDRNPAVVATLKRRFPLIRTFGVDVGRAAARLAEQGFKIQYANLDFCSPVDSVFGEVETLAHAACFDHDSLVAVNMLRGRERGGVLRRHADEQNIGVTLDRSHPLSQSPVTDRSRLLLLGRALSGCLLGHRGGFPVGVTGTYFPSLLRSGTYRSTAGTQTMLWGIFGLHKQPCPCQRCSSLQAGIDRESSKRIAVITETVREMFPEGWCPA